MSESDQLTTEMVYINSDELRLKINELPHPFLTSYPDFTNIYFDNAGFRITNYGLWKYRSTVQDMININITCRLYWRKTVWDMFYKMYQIPNTISIHYEHLPKNLPTFHIYNLG